MQTFYLNPATGDMVFDAQNNIKMAEGPEEEAQAVRLLLGTNTGDWFLNTLHGLAYRYLQVKNPSETRIRAELLRALKQEERVAEVLDVQVELDRPGRHLKIGFEARMANGEVIEDEVVV